MNERRIFTVIWTFIAGGGKVEIEATSPENAAKQIDSWFSEEFRQKGTIYVFEGTAAFVRRPASLEITFTGV